MDVRAMNDSSFHLTIYLFVTFFLHVNCYATDDATIKQLDESGKKSGKFIVDLKDFMPKPEPTTEEPMGYKSGLNQGLNPIDFPAKLPAACPGDTNPLYPICENVRGPLRHVRFTNYTICVFNKPEGFTEKVAAWKSVVFGFLAVWGVLANACIVLGGILQRRQTRNSLLALVSLGDLVFVALHFTVDLMTFDDSYDNWVLGEFSCYSVRGFLMGANAFSNMALMVIFLYQFACTSGKERLEQVCGGNTCGTTLCLFFVSLARMAGAMAVTSYAHCVLRDNSHFQLCNTVNGSHLSFIQLASFRLGDMILFQFVPSCVVVICARFTLPIVEFRAARFKNELTVANAKFYHTIIVIGMLTLALSVSTAMIETFMDLLNYPPSATLQLMLRTLPYINCALIKPIVYLAYFHEIFPKRSQIFQRNPRNRSVSSTSRDLSRNTSDPRLRQRAETNDSELTTEEILNGIRELKRQSSMTPLRTPSNQFGLLRYQNSDSSFVVRSKSFDSHLNSRILNNAKLPRPLNIPAPNKSFANPLYDSPLKFSDENSAQVSGENSKRNSRYVNLENVTEWINKKPTSESQLLRPSSMYINLGALSKNRQGQYEQFNNENTPSENPDNDKIGQNSEQKMPKTENDEISELKKMPKSALQSKSVYNLSSFTNPNSVQFAVDLHVYSDIKYHKQVSEDSGCYSSPGTPNHVNQGQIPPVAVQGHSNNGSEVQGQTVGNSQGHNDVVESAIEENLNENQV